MGGPGIVREQSTENQERKQNGNTRQRGSEEQLLVSAVETQGKISKKFAKNYFLWESIEANYAIETVELMQF